MATPKVSISKVLVRGEHRFRVNYRKDGRRVREIFPSKSAAEAEANRVRSDIQQLGAAWIKLPASERSRLMDAWSKAKTNGVDLLTIAAKPIVAAAAKSLSAVITELDTAKGNAGRADGYRKTMLSVLNAFAKGRESLAVDQITLANVESFLDARSLAYRSTLRSRLSTLFNFAVRRGYLIKNPCDQLESVTYHTPPPQIFTPAQLKAALTWLRDNPRGMTWFILTTLCGLRPEEAQKTTKDKIHTKAGIVVVDTQTAKVRERRVVVPMPEAMKWLKLSLKLGGELPLPKQFKRRLLHRLRAVVGFKVWPKDITRHTAATIWLARIKSAAEVAEQLGNSERVLKRDYKALITPKQLDELLAVIKTAK